MRVLVTGGSGHLGRDLVRMAAQEGHDVRVLSRRPGPDDASIEWVQADLATGAGLTEAVSGMDAVVHAASAVQDTQVVDVDGTRRLCTVAREAGVGHQVCVSIVGIDDIPFPYYRLKRAAEAEVESGGVPFSILRAAQFHYFVDLLLSQASRVPLVLPVPRGFSVQSIATEDVAAELVEILEGAPRGRTSEIFGPEALTLRDAARQWTKVRGLARPVVEVPVPGATAAGFRKGYNTNPGRPGGRETWRAWLERRYR